MNSSTSRWGHCREIDHKVANLTKEVILIGIPVAPVRIVRIRVDHCDTLEASRSFDGWNRHCVTDELRIVELNERLADHIRSRREIDNSRCDSGGVTAISTTVARGNSTVDSCSVICGSISIEGYQSPNDSATQRETYPFAPKS